MKNEGLMPLKVLGYNLTLQTMRETFCSHDWKFPSSVPAAPWPLLAGSCDRTPGPVLGFGDRWLLGKTNTRWGQKQGKYVTIYVLS